MRYLLHREIHKLWSLLRKNQIIEKGKDDLSSIAILFSTVGDAGPHWQAIYVAFGWVQ